MNIPVRSAMPEVEEPDSSPWVSHLRLAAVLSALTFAAAQFWSPAVAAALGAVTFFVAFRPLFLQQPSPPAIPFSFNLEPS